MKYHFTKTNDFTEAELDLLATIRRATDQHHLEVSGAYADICFSTAVYVQLTKVADLASRLKIAGGIGLPILTNRQSAIGAARQHLNEIIRRGVEL